MSLSPLRLLLATSLALVVLRTASASGDDHDDDHDDHEEDENFPLEYKWAAAIVTGVILSVNSLIGAFLLQFIGKGAIGAVLQFALVVLSISVMVSDSLMHIYPHAVEGAPHSQVTFLGITAFVGCLAVLLFSQLLHSFHSHPKKHPPAPAPDRTPATVMMFTVVPPDDGDTCEEKKEEGNNAGADAHGGDVEKSGKKGGFDWRSVESYGWAALAGDVVCNFVDGIAVGVSWYVGWFVGLVTSIAILAHEIPQEMSDYAVLRLSGLSNCLVIAVNITASTTSLIGIAVGLGFSTVLESAVEDFERYCLAFTCGAWLTIALFLLTPIALKLYGELTMLKKEGEQEQQGVTIEKWMAILVAVTMMAIALGLMAGIGVLEETAHEHEDNGHEGHDH
ncbi:unnamed protein product [Vitrella brassicaformis CCMP3155]|uniref:Uncharacterized protein n=2 Tax=Vitrella brassicaformis TaxID=1169539 RepID=A0A0G4H806_VITBC|nr:unnamed protein product [Vitrella brassicaformis CCMP3155]|eukprot:CEM39822.1 unnamed protein product [Vitrella brassicaformis CCMP3155]